MQHGERLRIADRLEGRRVTVMGLGRFGGGLGVTRWLCAHGARVLLTDLADAEVLAGPLASLAEPLAAGRITLRLGEHREEDFAAADLVIANPAVPTPWRNRYLAAARAASVPIATEISLLVDLLARRGVTRTVGITGSAGKSTTAALIASLLETALPRVHLGGNIGGSLLERAERFGPEDAIVLELSSAMLHWLANAPDPWSPSIAVLTNLSPNHLDWHGDFAAYSGAKAAIRGARTEAFVTRFELEQPEQAAEAARTSVGAWWATPPIETGEPLPFDPAELPLALPGEHNQRNATLAIVAARTAVERWTGAAVDVERLAVRCGAFEGLPHRLRTVLERDGIRFVDDSKSTTPDATLLAVRSFPDPQRIHLIAGGYDKGSDLSPIRDLAPALGRLYAIGATGPRLVGANVSLCATLEAAVAEASSRLRPGDILLLSPGCASWDQFTNFEARGQRFAELVREERALPARH
jgi:UDP-N-acetylmuramoylalanine--D-glutamate ligase